MKRLVEKWLNGKGEQGGFHIGQKVMVKIDSGAGPLRGPFTIIGFCDPPKGGGGTIFLDWDCYWFAVKEENLRAYKQK